VLYNYGRVLTRTAVDGKGVRKRQGRPYLGVYEISEELYSLVKTLLKHFHSVAINEISPHTYEVCTLMGCVQFVTLSEFRSHTGLLFPSMSAFRTIFNEEIVISEAKLCALSRIASQVGHIYVDGANVEIQSHLSQSLEMGWHEGS